MMNGESFKETYGVASCDEQVENLVFPQGLIYIYSLSAMQQRMRATSRPRTINLK